jgi:hypothetical protein
MCLCADGFHKFILYIFWNHLQRPKSNDFDPENTYGKPLVTQVHFERFFLHPMRGGQRRKSSNDGEGNYEE